MQLSGSQGVPDPRPVDPQATGSAASSGVPRSATGGTPAKTGATASPGAALLQVEAPEALSLEAGTVIQGRVVAQDGDNVTLELLNQLVQAATPLPLTEGTLLDLEVRGQQKGQWLLQVLQTRLHATLTDRDLARVVRDLRLPVTEDSLVLARSMVEAGLPLTRSDFQELARVLAQLPGAPPRTPDLAAAACFLKASQLPMTPSNLLALATHLARHPVLGAQLAHVRLAGQRFLASASTSTGTHASANVHASAGTRATGGVQAPTLTQGVTHLATRLERLAPSAATTGVPPEPHELQYLAFQAGIEPVPAPAPLSPPARAWSISILQQLSALEAQLELPTAQPELREAFTRLQEALVQLAREPGAQRPFIEVQSALRSLATLDLPHPLAEALSTIPGMERLHSAALLRQLSRLLGDVPHQDPPTGELRQALEALARSLAEPAPPQTGPAWEARQHLLESHPRQPHSPEVRDVLDRLEVVLRGLEDTPVVDDAQASRRDLLSLLGLGSAAPVEEVATHDHDMVAFLQTLSRQLGAEGSDATEAATLRGAIDNLADNFVALRLLNAAVTSQGAWFLPLPLGMGGRTAQVRIAIRVDRQGRPVVDAEGLLFEIVIPTEHLGHVRWQVRLKGGELALDAYLGDEEWRAHLDRSLPRLVGRLQEVGYVIKGPASHLREHTGSDVESTALAGRRTESPARINLRI